MPYSDSSDTPWESLYAFVDRYQANTATVAQEADAVIATFEHSYKKWRQCTEYFYSVHNETKDGSRYYGIAIVIYSIALCTIKDSKRAVDAATVLQREVERYCKEVDYRGDIKADMWHNLALCQHNGGALYERDAIEAFKKEAFYQLDSSNNTSHSNLECYTFRRIDKYLLESLVRESIGLSSPSVFNDIFDCPLMEILSADDEIARLIRTAYSECLKVACFCKNDKLTYTNEKGDIVHREKKHENDEPEYQKELLWAHYADSHRGVCIRYMFPGEFTTHTDDGRVLFFKDVVYKDDLKYLKEKNGLNLEEAFFVKSSCWEYENELRLVCYNPSDKGQELHGTMSAKNVVAAVYFGVKCPAEDRESIIRLLQGRHYEKKLLSIKDNKLHEEVQRLPVEFYQMEKDPEVFGKIRARRIEV